ncbi:Enamine deaminase RidA, house cleaning of reactive enamine intermediates, YjgF/YER057c/UK114 family [Thermosyntropha lipolytica DSM 11003]|uniref:Enamine deaminase RidA, house cleaning of reactive enamine intermediates, YjgF/YER057c/UK114 family n=1 Tax=Thermosyntropha lipolytica DSM 11003 TaxID=1123382 RepID=A0A1M5NDU6_9FIRM|nr:RidA family protein [Thermosyntropha lipolytica]SHG87691.1 Enamine deaminase RidA, house cleaning of reactive enamine intermediates, YjgF/YER057c/UK114 family [Thermosyntropha lipolytica DSM 11003]
MNIEQRLNNLGITIPEVAKPLAAYVPALKAGEFVYISGQLPLREGKLVYSGKLGRDLSVEEGQRAAEICLINCLAALKSCIGSLDKVERIVKITGYVQSADDFYEQPQVINGASLLLEKIFGEKGIHARAAVGVNALPLNAACEVEMVVQVRE